MAREPSPGGPLAALVGARIRRVDVPEPDLVALTLGGGQFEDAVVLALTTDRHAGLGCVPERPRGRPAEGVAKLLRNLLEGARLVAAGTEGAAHVVEMRRGEAPARLVHESGAPANVLVLDETGRTVAALHPERLAARGLALGQPWSAPVGAAEPAPGGLEALLARGQQLLDARRDDERATRAIALGRALRRAKAKAERRAEATAQDLEAAAQAPSLRTQASAIFAQLASIPRGATEVELTDWTLDPPAALRVTLDPARPPREQAERLFDRARRLEAGARIARARHEEACAEAARLTGLVERLAAPDADLAALEGEASALGVARPPPPRRRATEERTPFRRYHGHGGRPILVGRSAADNDTLTFRHARPHDLWLHVRDRGGSHVVVPLARGESCPAELLVDAAHLAAHFSTARGEPSVEVQYAPRSEVRRPRGGAPGTVLVGRARVLGLRLEPERLAALLAAPP